MDFKMNNVIEREIKMPRKYTNRSDGWTDEHDAIVVDVVIDYVRNGETQLNAFKVAGQKIGRTQEAVGYRWNVKLRKIPEVVELLDEAKAERLRNKKTRGLEKSRGWLTNKEVVYVQAEEERKVIELPHEVCEDIDLYKLENKEYDLLYIIQQDTQLSSFLKDPENVKLYMDALRYGYEAKYDPIIDAYSHYLQVCGERESLSLNEFLKVVQYTYDKTGGIEHGR